MNVALLLRVLGWGYHVALSISGVGLSGPWHDFVLKAYRYLGVRGFLLSGFPGLFGVGLNPKP